MRHSCLKKVLQRCYQTCDPPVPGDPRGRHSKTLIETGKYRQLTCSSTIILTHVPSHQRPQLGPSAAAAHSGTWPCCTDRGTAKDTKLPSPERVSNCLLVTIATTTASHEKKKKKPLYVSGGTSNLVAVIETMFQEPAEIPAPCSKFHAAKISGRLGSGHMQAIPIIFFFGHLMTFSIGQR